MRTSALLLTLVVAGFLVAQTSTSSVKVKSNEIGGVVSSSKGPEAGVWVIAETNDLPTKFVRIVVTDDEGRYLIPDLPKATYSVWVRGYGLVADMRLPDGITVPPATFTPNTARSRWPDGTYDATVSLFRKLYR